MSESRIERITVLQAGSDLFRSTGYSRLKITKGGVVKVVELPIKSSGVTEVIERARANEPKPPAKPMAVGWDSPEGRAAKVARGQSKTVMAPDLTDAGYVAARERYEEELALDIIDQGLDVPITKAGGEPTTTRDEKIAVLRSLGMSLPQFSQLVDDIQALTTLTEQDREAFFGAPSIAGATTDG